MERRMKQIKAGAKAFPLACALGLFAAPSVSAGNSMPGAKIIATVPIGAGASSNDVAVNPTTGRVYIPNFSSFNVSVLDGHTNTIIATIPVGNGADGDVDGPTSSAIDEKTNTIYVTNNNGVLSVIDGNTNNVTSQYTVDTTIGMFGITALANPRLSRKTGKLYVSNEGAQYDVIDPKSQKVLSTIPTDNAGWLAINQRTNKIYAPQYWDGTVWVIDGDTDKVVKIIQGVGLPSVPLGCYDGPDGMTDTSHTCATQSSGLDGVAVDEVNNRIYVVGTNDNRLVTIDGNTDKVINIQYIKNTTGFGLLQVAVNPLTNTVYTIDDAITTDGIVTVVDGNTNQITDSVPTAPYANLYGVAVNPRTGIIYVVGDGDQFTANPVSSLYVLEPTQTK
jgi:YVTN family beta-propeller protein